MTRLVVKRFFAAQSLGLHLSAFAVREFCLSFLHYHFSSISLCSARDLARYCISCRLLLPPFHGEFLPRACALRIDRTRQTWNLALHFPCPRRDIADPLIRAQARLFYVRHQLGGHGSCAIYKNSGKAQRNLPSATAWNSTLRMMQRISSRHVGRTCSAYIHVACVIGGTSLSELKGVGTAAGTFPSNWNNDAE